MERGDETMKGVPQTQAEVDAHNERVARGRTRMPIPGPTKPFPATLGKQAPVDEHPESDLHEKIRAECVRRGWVALHGSMAHRAWRPLGEPDFIVFAPGGVVYCLECKTRTGKLTNEQAGMLAWLRRLGHRAEVVRSFEEFLAIVDGLPFTPEHRRD